MWWAVLATVVALLVFAGLVLIAKDALSAFGPGKKNDDEEDEHS